MFIEKLKNKLSAFYSKGNQILRIGQIPFFILWILVSFQFLLRHEMWRDEVEGWLMVSHLDFFQWRDYLRNSGHPSLFYLLLYPIAFFSTSLFSLQLFNFAISTFATGIFFFSFRLPLVLRYLFLAGSFFLYRLPVFARNYSLGFLLLTLGLLWFQSSHRIKRRISYASLLLLPQTHTLFVLAAIPFGVYFLLSLVYTRRLRVERFWFLSLLILSGLIVLYTIFPKSEGQFQDNLFQNNPLVWRHVVPYAFFPSWTKSQIAYGLLWAFWLAFAYLLRSNKPLLSFYLTGVSLFLFFFRFLYVAHLHHLIVFFLFLLAVWELFLRQTKLPKFHEILVVFFFLSSISQIQYLAKEDAKDWNQHFSSSSWAAEALLRCGWKPTFSIATHPPDETKTILGYLPPSTKFQFPALNREGTHMLWDQEFKKSYLVPWADIEDQMVGNPTWEFVVTNAPLSEKASTVYQLCEAPPANTTITKNEIFFPYRRKFPLP